ncbi:hypothetical protein E2I00_011966 [Balaenoptera physalus]|uniref:Uncharacterized protein n=1 Tax=Balaenoptera physalus TaxID=9770 RepID=A0A643BYB2_BALPH|nr:hypothetical protein E2I00_011966 [Balaenoptera physalus]
MEKGVFKCLFSSLQPKCCGMKNYTDFPSFGRMTGHTYPRGCYKSIGTVACDGHNVSADVTHQEQGCFPKLLKITKTQSINLSGGSLGAAVI